MIKVFFAHSPAAEADEDISNMYTTHLLARFHAINHYVDLGQPVRKPDRKFSTKGPSANDRVLCTPSYDLAMIKL